MAWNISAPLRMAAAATATAAARSSDIALGNFGSQPAPIERIRNYSGHYRSHRRPDRAHTERGTPQRGGDDRNAEQLPIRRELQGSRF
jgi:hypothetical protein